MVNLYMKIGPNGNSKNQRKNIRILHIKCIWNICQPWNDIFAISACGAGRRRARSDLIYFKSCGADRKTRQPLVRFTAKSTKNAKRGARRMEWLFYSYFFRFVYNFSSNAEILGISYFKISFSFEIIMMEWAFEFARSLNGFIKEIISVIICLSTVNSSFLSSIFFKRIEP